MSNREGKKQEQAEWPRLKKTGSMLNGIALVLVFIGAILTFMKMSH